jgi:hypothetical protein
MLAIATNTALRDASLFPRAIQTHRAFLARRCIRQQKIENTG